MTNDFEILEHTADLEIRVYGATKQELFKHALQGMFQCMGPKNKTCDVVDGRVVCKNLPLSREIGVNSQDTASLLVDFLSEALYLSDVHNEAYLDVRIATFEDTYIQATLYGIEVEGFSECEIKAVTYHDMKLEQVNGVWQVDVVFDI